MEDNTDFNKIRKSHITSTFDPIFLKITYRNTIIKFLFGRV